MMHSLKGKLSLNRRQRTILDIAAALVFIMTIVIGGFIFDEGSIGTNLSERNVPPSFQHFFGTDWLGRDMFARTVMGLSLSMGVGLIGAFSSASIALILGLAAATLGKAADTFISWLIDLFLSVPHLVTLILISFALGGGFKGIVIGIAFTHWPSLARVIRAEVMQIRSAEYVHISRKMGKTRTWIAIHHIMPHLVSQFIIGFLLLFPHTILHEAAVTFLGLGLSPHEPAIGIILSESMKHLSSGLWWLAFFPGLSLLLVVRLFDVVGDRLRMLIDPAKAHN
jgi:peptide/nickel transport system permease protein